MSEPDEPKARVVLVQDEAEKPGEALRQRRMWQVVGAIGRALLAMRSSLAPSCQAQGLAAVDEHLLRDIGLTRMDVRCQRSGVPASPRSDSAPRDPACAGRADPPGSISLRQAGERHGNR